MRRGFGSTSYVSQVQALAPNYGVPPSLAVAVMNAESSGNPNAVSPAGAQGLFQIMPANDASLGVTNPFDATQNITAGLSLLQQYYNQFGNWTQALEAYNEGPGALAANGAYASTATYAANILSAAGLDSTAAGTSAGTASTALPDSSSGSSSDLASTGSISDLFDSIDTVDLSAVTGLSWPVLGGIAAVLFAGLYALSRTRTS